MQSSDRRPAPLAAFARHEDGAITAFAIFTVVCLCMMLGIAVDAGNAYRQRTQLQVATDVAAHAAIYIRETSTQSDATSKAVAIAHDTMAVEDDLDPTLTSADVTFGTWDETTRTFTANSASRSAVRVSAGRTEERENPVSTFMLRLAGVDIWNVSASTVAETYRPTCLREGFVAEGVVDIQSNNTFVNGFCMHSNTYVSLNQNNTFEAGTIVSMPHLDDLDVPNSGMEKNDGLEEALRESFYNIRILSRVGGIIDGIANLSADYLPDYITNTTVVTLTSKSPTVTDFVAGKMYRLACSGNKVTISTNGAATTVSKVVIMASCPVTFAQGVALEDVVFTNTSTDAKSFNAPSGVRLGKDDGCAAGGGAQLVTMGGVNFAAAMQMYGSQILALGTVEFAANADGIEGASIVSRDGIDGTSNMTMGYCGSGMEDNFEADYFRIVQ
ncbi:pilus assembly protein TadG-related protein [Frigidibacter sp. MR17.14]|uniref:pilus assembly protein TadG-related protein n=1 Tax=Frigidibacter sp. MR17.14 TaxID=3126509 RepID=UPI003012BFC1